LATIPLKAIFAPCYLKKTRLLTTAGKGKLLPPVPRLSLFARDLETTRKLYLESYGCAMNFSDSEIVASIMTGIGFETTPTTDNADVILLNTCAIRENAELRIWQRLKTFKRKKEKIPR
jgi:hypothetical protein